MAKYVDVQAVVLRTADYKETSRMATLFTREIGLLSASAKGVKRPKSPLLGRVELFTRADYTLSVFNERYQITSAQVRESHIELSADMEKLTLAAYFKDFCLAVLGEGDPQPLLFDLLSECLLALCRAQSDWRSVKLYFEVKALSILGFLPVLEACADCGQVLPGTGDIYLSAAAGGVVCAQCKPGYPDAAGLLPGTLATLRRMLAWSGDNLHVLRSAGAIERNLEEVWPAYLAYYLEKRFTLGDFLDKLTYFRPPG